MKIYIHIITDRDMRPRSDITGKAVFASREGAMTAMGRDIYGMIEAGQIAASEIEFSADACYAASADGRFAWKVEERVACECRHMQGRPACEMARSQGLPDSYMDAGFEYPGWMPTEKQLSHFRRWAKEAA